MPENMPLVVPVDHDPFADDQLAATMTHQAEVPNPAKPAVEYGKAIGKYLWDRATLPVRAAKEVTEQAMRGEAVSEDPEGIQRAWKAASGLAMAGRMPGGIFAAPKGAAGVFGGKLVQPPERILGAAVQGTNGKIYHAPMHYQAMEKAAQDMGVSMDEIYGHLEPDVGRFLTDKGRMLDRAEAGLLTTGKENHPIFAEELGTQSPSITAYHGSPHDFDKFDIGKIGTGEGRQAYGHGLYFAENEGVARSYKPAPPVVANAATRELVQKAVQHAQDQGLTGADVKGSALQFLNDKALAASGRERQAYFDAMNNYDGLAGSGGRMYQVSINADPEHFLDWDKPLSEQSPAALEKLKTVVRPDPNRTVADWINHSPGAEQRLREAGIPGIKYLDQGSRGKGDGTRNFVVFSDDLIQIMKKYGLAGLAALPAAGAYHFQAHEEPRTVH